MSWPPVSPPLDHTILSGGHPRAKAPLVLDNEGAGVIEDAGDSGLAVGSRVMFTGPYGLSEAGTWQDWLLVRAEHLTLVPDPSTTSSRPPCQWRI